MWLLTTARAELKFFSNLSSVPDGYAILSHTWNDQEESFQDLQAIISRCKLLMRNPRNYVSPKIRNCCLQAEHDGYAWVWIDTCCIDKTSSTELSEAINSMFTWYVQAEVCYAFLEDVSFSDVVDLDNSEFTQARWHTRGWTLQELLAPAAVLFMSKDWKRLGTKRELAPLIERVTGIQQPYLTREADFREASISTRMRWAARRRTTRVEDEAYSLLGLFNINMPTLYGEGTRAFLRLQEEIAKRSFDTTLFAWGDVHRRDWESTTSVVPVETLHEHRLFSDLIIHERFLFASSARSFVYGDPMRYTPKLQHPIQPYLPNQWNKDAPQPAEGPFGRFELPSFQMTNNGMKCRFPIAEIDDFTIAVLLCETTSEHVGLILHPSNETDVQDVTRKAYYIGREITISDTSVFRRYTRLVYLGNDWYNLTFRGKPIRAEWKNIYIQSGVDRDNTTDTLSYWIPDCVPSLPFRIPRALFRSLVSLDLIPLTSVWRLRSNLDFSHACVVFMNLHDTVGEGVVINLGLCGDSEQMLYRTHWAKVYIHHQKDDELSEPPDEDVHDCATDHIDDWPDWTREFGDAERTVRLSFSRCVHHPQVTRVVHLELSGTHFEDLKQRPRGGFIGARYYPIVVPSSEDVAEKKSVEAEHPPNEAGVGPSIGNKPPNTRSTPMSPSAGTDGGDDSKRRTVGRALRGVVVTMNPASRWRPWKSRRN